MVYRLHISSLVLNQVMKHQCRSNDLSKVHMDHVIHYKLFKGQSFHTFGRMITYCVKDTRKEHYNLQVVDVNISNVKKNVGIDEYTKFGSVINKNCVTLFNINTINRVFVWCKEQRMNKYDILFPLWYWI